MSMLRKICVFIFIFTSITYGSSKKPPIITPVVKFNRDVPVQLAKSTVISISVRGEAVLECYRDSDLGEIYYFSNQIEIQLNDDGISVYDADGVITDGLVEIKCVPRHKASFLEFENKSYRGIMRVIQEESSADMLLLNILDMEDYLKGVLPSEIGRRSKREYEAAKAQAVAARTYAFWKLMSEGSSGKLYPTIADQVYSGRDSEISILSKAIKQTEGQVMAIGDKPIAAYYHAVCGGNTIPITEAWPQNDPETYLIGVDDDNYCRWARTFEWTEYFDYETLKNNLEIYFVDRQLAVYGDFDTILDINFELDYSTNRMYLMEIKTDNGVFQVEKDQIRWALGRPSSPGAILPSTRFVYEAEINEFNVTGLKISGYGNGHGVGICQCGLIGRARDGQKYNKMLETYYHGASLVRLY